MAINAYGRPSIILVIVAAMLTVAAIQLVEDERDSWVPTASATGVDSSGVDLWALNRSSIIGGEIAERGAWPWQIALEFRGSSGLLCGGVLISEEWVVTAAHCIFMINFNPDAIQVRLGVHNRATDTGIVINPAELIVHENTFLNQPPDLALVRLSQPVTLSAEIQPVPYGATTAPNLYAPGMVGTVTGWGSTSADAITLPNELRQLSLPVRDNATCIAEIGEGHNGISGYDICAGQLVATESGCLGDSGGPFVTQTSTGEYVMIGVVSRASDTTRDCQSYNIFTHIPQSAEWIEANSGVAPYEVVPDFVPTDYMFLPLVVESEVVL